jgi:hypothetical protein
VDQVVHFLGFRSKQSPVQPGFAPRLFSCPPTFIGRLSRRGGMGEWSRDRPPSSRRAPMSASRRDRARQGRPNRQSRGA